MFLLSAAVSKQAFSVQPLSQHECQSINSGKKNIVLHIRSTFCVKQLISTKRKKVFMDFWVTLFLSPRVLCYEWIRPLQTSRQCRGFNKSVRVWNLFKYRYVNVKKQLTLKKSKRQKQFYPMEMALERDSESLCICHRSATVWKHDCGHVTVSSRIKQWVGSRQSLKSLQLLSAGIF